MNVQVIFDLKNALLSFRKFFQTLSPSDVSEIERAHYGRHIGCFVSQLWHHHSPAIIYTATEGAPDLPLWAQRPHPPPVETFCLRGASSQMKAG